MAKEAPIVVDEADIDYSAYMAAIDRVMAVVEFDPMGIFIRANGLFFKAMGYDVAELRGAHHRLFVHPAEAASASYDDFWKRLRNGEPVQATFERLAKGGRRVVLQASYNPIYDENGKIVRFVKYATDITATTVAAEEEAVKRQAAQLAETLRIKSALEGATTGMMIADANLDIVYMNTALREMLKKHEPALNAQFPGFRVDDIIGRNIDIFHKNPAHQRGMLKSVYGSHRTRIALAAERWTSS